MYEVYDYLFYYDGSSLYLFNFTPALEKSLPSYAPKNITYVYFNGIYHTNGSWYVNVSVSTYSPETVKSFNFDYIYKLNLKNFCVEQTNITFHTIPVKATNETINGWKIVIPSEFLPSPDYGPLKAYFFLGVSPNITKPRNCCSVLAIPSYSKLPVYFLLEKDGQAKNVTLFYINATENLTGFWFPENVKIVNVTICKRTTNTVTEIETTPRSNTTKTKDICGPGLIDLLALVPLVLRRR
ncbi:CGP-CTERM sorting domain-containing protein [Thermococcus sp.]